MAPLPLLVAALSELLKLELELLLLLLLIPLPAPPLRVLMLIMPLLRLLPLLPLLLRGDKEESPALSFPPSLLANLALGSSSSPSMGAASAAA